MGRSARDKPRKLGQVRETRRHLNRRVIDDKLDLPKK